MEKQLTDPNEPINMDTTYSGTMGGTYGLTKREHFAALFMQGSLASYTNPSVWPNAQVFSEEAVKYADALIEELNK